VTEPTHSIPGVPPDTANVRERLRRYWDADAATYDRSPTHAGTDAAEAAAWRAALARHLPQAGARILDVGAGTGTVAVLAAELGHRVTALDLSPRMLEQAGRKAAARGLDIDIVVGPADEPPPGPFDAVMERHLLWTLPDPVGALVAWRRVAPAGRLVSYEGIFGRPGLGTDLRRVASSFLRQILRIPPDHHRDYEPELLAALPLAGRTGPGALVQAVLDGGWRGPRLERLHDVEWARRLASPWPLGWVETVPHFALIAES